MNTRQKLTLGIVAIFMVTLTIVGVTYAYFVTQVVPGTPADVDVQTATFGNVTFNKDESYITIKSMATCKIDEETGKVTNTDVCNEELENFGSLNYSVSNDGQNALAYDLTLKHEDLGQGFLKSKVEEGFNASTACYNLTDEALTNPNQKCYEGDYYDNIHVVITQYDNEGRTGTGTEIYNGKLMSEVAKDIKTDISIAAGDTHYYTITVVHIDAGMNQNLETNASLKVIPDIDNVG